MPLIPEHLRRALTINWELMIVAPEAGVCPDLYPEVKLFTPNANAIWLLTELNPERNVAYGLCDLGLGQPELGYVDLNELEALAATEGFVIEVDLQFDTHTPLSKYTELAKSAGRIEDW
jgi:hypothetical protein